MASRPETGSSPRVRGTGCLSGDGRPGVRFIPARAGNSSSVNERPSTAPVHPRACGEQQYRRCGLEYGTGSSPRVRGTGPQNRIHYPRRRFIPARAGNSRGDHRRHGRAAVHPRACGEQASSTLPSSPVSGSSPRVRGTVGYAALASLVRRFIPARAGNSKWHCHRHPCSAVHPRACGEQAFMLPSKSISNGSSPRVRGTGVERVERQSLQRFIPARAGNSCYGRPEQRSVTVHPRACGEQFNGCDVIP